MKTKILAITSVIMLLLQSAPIALATSIKVDGLHIEDTRGGFSDVNITTTLPSTFDPSASSGGLKVSFINPQNNLEETPILWAWEAGAFEANGEDRFHLILKGKEDKVFVTFFLPKDGTWQFLWHSIGHIPLPIVPDGLYEFKVELKINMETMTDSVLVCKNGSKWKIWDGRVCGGIRR